MISHAFDDFNYILSTLFLSVQMLLQEDDRLRPYGASSLPLLSSTFNKNTTS